MRPVTRATRLLRAAFIFCAALPPGHGWTGPAAPAPGKLPDRAEVILHAAMRPPNWDIYLFEPVRGRGEGHRARRLTQDPALDYNPAFSPDGRWLVFTSDRRGGPDLWLLDLKDGGPERPLTDDPAMEDAAAFSPDARLLAFVSTRQGNAEILVMPFRPDGVSDAGEAVNVTGHPAGDFNPAFSPDGRRLAFASNRNGYGGSDLFVMNHDGTGIMRLTTAPGWEGSPAWSPDGRHIYYYASGGGQPGIRRIGADGAGDEPVAGASGAALSPAVSRDGRVYWSARRGETWRIVSLEPSAGDPRTVGDERRSQWAPDVDRASGRIAAHGEGPLEAAAVIRYRRPAPFAVAGSATVISLPDRGVSVRAVRGFSPSLDPAGEWVASDDRFDRIVVSRMDGSGFRELFRPRGDEAWAPTWTADGRSVIFSAGPTFAGERADVDLLRVSREGGETVNLTPRSSANDAFPVASADGRFVVFRSGRDGNHEIYLMRPDGTGLRRLTDDPATDTMPGISRDGRMVAFSSNRDGDFDIYTVELSADGEPGRLRRVTRHAGLDMHPKFSPDGLWLVFASDRGGINDEEPLLQIYNPQPYGEIFVVRLEDRHVIRITHNKWEDGTPIWGLLPPGRKGP